MAHHSFKPLIWSAFVPLALGAQDKLPPLREINVRIAQSADSFGARVSAGVLSNGAIAISEFRRARFIILDPTLEEAITVFDRLSPPPLTFPQFPSRVLVGPGDTIFVPDLPGRGVRVIAGGQLVRRQTVADGEDLVRLNGEAGGAQFGAHGDVYFTSPLVRRRPGDFSAEPHDSLYLVHLVLATMRSDTVGIIEVRRLTNDVPGDSIPNEPRPFTRYYAPFTVGDAMALNSRGELAVIRASDFHVDWLMPDGKWRKSPPIPWPWHRYTADEKAAITASRDSFFQSGQVQTLSPEGGPRPRVTLRSGAVPDLEPAFAPMNAIADPNGLIWLQLGWQSLSVIQPRAVYGAIDSSGQLVDRIILPEGRRLLGIDKAGHIYAATRTGRIEAFQGKPK